MNQQHDLNGPSYRVRVNALYNIWTFCNIIKFRGGSKNFSKTVHPQLASFLTYPQTTKEDAKEFRRRLVLLARGHLKSTLTLLCILWRFYRNPNLRVLFGCDDLKLGRAFIRELEQYLVNKDLQENVWNKRPHIPGPMVPMIDAVQRRERTSSRDLYIEQTGQKVIWTSDAIQLIRPEVLKEPSVFITSVGVTATGDHIDLLVLDDIVNFTNADTPSKAGKIAEWASDLESVLDPPRLVTVGKYLDPKTEEIVNFSEWVGDEVIMNGTLYFKHDEYSHILKNYKSLKYKIFKKNLYVNGKNSEDGYNYPEKFNDEYVETLKIRCKTRRRFAAQYLLEILDDENRQFEDELIHCLQHENIRVLFDGLVELTVNNTKKVVRPILSVDPAISLEKRADYTAVGVIGVDDELNVYLIDGRKKRMLPNETIDYLFHLSEKYKCTTAVLEGGVGFQDALIFSFQNEMRIRKKFINVKRYIPRGNKVENIALILEPVVNNGRLYVSQHLISHVREELQYLLDQTVEDDLIDMLHIGVKSCTPHSYNKITKVKTRHVSINKKYGGCR